MRKTPLHKKIWMLCLALLCTLFCVACAGAEEPEATSPSETVAAEHPTPTAVPLPTPEPLDERLLALQLSELMPVNRSCLPDEDGDFSDWLELFNSGSEPLSLEGLWLSDSLRDWNKWPLPARTLDPGEYLLIFCSGKDRSEGELHSSFSLSGQGETLSLRSASGQPIWEHSYESTMADVALRFEDGACTQSREATPGYPNTSEGREAFLRENDRHGALVINEAVVYNEDYAWHVGDYYDWIELKNVSDTAIDLSRYTLSDKVDERERFRLPAVTLQPGALFIVFCGEPGADTPFCHAPFQLSAAGETLYLSEDEGGLSDFMGLYELPLGSSYGRMDGQPGFFFFDQRTPNAPNAGGSRLVSEKPAALPAQGLFAAGETVTVTLSGEGTIYYTLNGSAPTMSSAVYTEPIQISASTVIRAICCADGRIASDPVSFSYLIGAEHTLPIVSLACDPRDFNALEIGKSDLVYDGDFTLFDGEAVVQLGCGYKLHGASSRTVWDRKTLKLSFKNRYDGDMNYDLFGDGRNEYHAILLRGGFMSAMQLYRDSLASLIANEVCPGDPLTLNSRYCVVYLNGKYRGVYAMREAYGPEYVASHTGSDPDAVKIIRIFARDLSDPDFSSSYSFVTTADYSEADNYARAAELFDMQSLAQWLCMESYFTNTDANGNLRFCKGNAAGDKWRTMLFDFDISMGSDFAMMEPVLQNDELIGILLNALRRSEQFRLLTLETASAMYKNGLNYEHVLAIFDSLTGQLEPELERDLSYWNESMAVYREHLQSQRAKFSENRDLTWLQQVQWFTRASDEQMREYFPDFYA